MTPRSAIVAFSLLMAEAASGIVISDPTGNPNLAPPPSPDPLANTGYLLNGAGGSVTYICEGWVLTAKHNIGLTNDVVFNGTTYGWDTSINGGTGYFDVDASTGLDLAMFRIQGDTGLNCLNFYCDPLASGDEIMMVGTGSTGEYNDNGTGFSGDDYYAWPGTRSSPPTAVWGTNLIDGVGQDIFGNQLFATDFDRPNSAGATTYEATGASGDSGGGAYINNGGNYELAGILFAVIDTEDQRSKYADEAYFINIVEYKESIFDLITGEAVPEPSGALLALGALASLSLRRRR